MKKIFYILNLISTTVFSQNSVSNQIFEYSDTSSVVVNAFVTGNYGSTLFDNEFIDKFRFGGFIDGELKNKALSKSKKLNYFGGESSYGISFSDPLHKLFGNWGYYAEISSNFSAGAQFTDDLYELVFYGNKILAGDTAFIRQSGFHSRSFKKFTFGLDNNNVKLGLSVLSFSKNSQGLVQDGFIFTDSTGNNVLMDIYAGKYESPSYTKYVGTGIAFDFEYRLHQKLFSEDSLQTKETTIIVGVKNIGVYFSKNNTISTDVDTIFDYQGIEISSFSEFGNSIISQQQLKDSLFSNTTASKIVGLLPFEIYFFKPAGFEKKAEMIYGFRYKIQSNYRAFIYVGGNFHLKKGLNISSYFGYGGYSKLQLGLSVNRRFNNLLVEVNSNNLLGLISKSQYGKAAGLSLKYNFK